jgi:hypothetical protein
MTSPRQRNLGPILAIAGAAVAMFAVIAGFVIVGGPGETRNQRLDDLVERRLDNVLAIVQCAFNATGTTPATLQEAGSVAGFLSEANVRQPCRGAPPESAYIPDDGSLPREPGDAAYIAAGQNSIRLCGYFRVARKEGEPNCSSSFFNTYPVLDAARPAGLHCYELQLKSAPALEMFPARGHRVTCAVEVFH